jgi:hypothetical protein
MPSDDYRKGYQAGRSEYQPAPLSESLKAIGNSGPVPAGCFVLLIAVTVIVCLVVAGWAYTQMQAQQPVYEGSPTASSIKPAFQPSSLGTSAWKDGGYSATVTQAIAQGISLQLTFDAQATGPGSLFSPEGSCIRVTNPMKQSERLQIYPVGSKLTSGTDQHYAGTLTYPLIVPGRYMFQYACSDGYSEVDVGTAANILVVNLSESSNTFFAVIFAVNHSDGNVSLLFSAAGTAQGTHSPLPAPDTSCISAPGSAVTPSVKNAWRAQNGSQSSLGSVIVGTMKFSKVDSNSFIYSCASDYSSVPLPQHP